MSRDLERLADLLGVAAGYTDAFGQPVETALEVRRGMIAALGFPVETDTDIAASPCRSRGRAQRVDPASFAGRSPPRHQRPDPNQRGQRNLVLAFGRRARTSP